MCDELNAYLVTGMEDVAPGDGLKWWHKRHVMYPCLFTHGTGLSDHPWYVYNLFIHLLH